MIPNSAVLPLFPGRAVRPGVADGFKTSVRGQPIRRLEVEGDQERGVGAEAPRRRCAVKVLGQNLLIVIRLICGTDTPAATAASVVVSRSIRTSISGLPSQLL